MYWESIFAGMMDVEQVGSELMTFHEWLEEHGGLLVFLLSPWDLKYKT